LRLSGESRQRSTQPCHVISDELAPLMKEAHTGDMSDVQPQTDHGRPPLQGHGHAKMAED